LTTMIRNIRTIVSAMGNGRKAPAASEANTADVARKSLVAAQFLPAGNRVDLGLDRSQKAGHRASTGHAR
jgi:sialic acid synthase SpsE